MGFLHDFTRHRHRLLWQEYQKDSSGCLPTLSLSLCDPGSFWDPPKISNRIHFYSVDQTDWNVLRTDLNFPCWMCPPHQRIRLELINWIELTEIMGEITNKLVLFGWYVTSENDTTGVNWSFGFHAVTWFDHVIRFCRVSFCAISGPEIRSAGWIYPDGWIDREIDGLMDYYYSM